MRKIITKIICFTAAAVAAASGTLLTACNSYYNAEKLDYTPSNVKAVSNGGFAVEKDGYVYFINGKQVNTADNSFGTPVRGAIMRISNADLAARKYSSAQTVVPHIAYSGNYNGGIFVYGDYVYYATPSTEKNSDGIVQNENLAFKSTRLDGTETLKGYYVQNSNSSVEYRYVQAGDTVYLLYVATGEDYYGTGDSYTNLHSVNTKTGENTMLAYNVGSVTFDKNDLTNPRVYYTMSVTDFELGKTYDTYNQVWTVTADATTPADYSEYFEKIYENDEDGYDPEKDPKYVNCGTLVYDGIGKIEGMTGSVTPFNGADADKVERVPYTYTISSYENGTLFYTRSSKTITSEGFSTASLYAHKDGAILNGWNPVTKNDEQQFILRDGANASSYTYLFGDNDKIENIIISDSTGLIKTKLDDNGKIITDVDTVNCYHLTKSGQPTILFTAKHNDRNYIYYSLSGGNGYTVNRICYDGDSDDYGDNKLPVGEVAEEFKPVKVLDLDSSSDWYKPEMLQGQLLFAAQTTDMTEYPYILACDLRVKGTDKVMNNAEIKALNELYESVSEKIGEVDAEDYQNLPNALRYAFYANESEYIKEISNEFVEKLGYSENYLFSEESFAAYDKFMNAEGDWAEFAKDSVEVNGVKITSNKRDYYYALLGRMNEEDAENYLNSLKSSYMPAGPEVEQSWFESLSTGAKVGFIIGVCAGGLLVIAAAVVIPLVIIRKRKNKMPEYTKKRIKVDTHDDKNIDVYSDENPENNG